MVRVAAGWRNLSRSSDKMPTVSSFRFLHAADIHLDSPLRGLDGQEGDIAERIRSAPRRAFENLVQFALDERVDFVVIAGDLYDGDWKDYRTGLFFVRQMGRLNAAQIPVFLLYGNHDAESRITKALELPENVGVFRGGKAHTFTLDELEVALHGQSFRNRAVTDNLVPGYPSPRKAMFNIGVLHTGLGGFDPQHDNYAPCSLTDLTAKGYDYWALGHIHQRQVLHKNPWVVFPGNLQGRHVRETGPKGAALVTVRDGEADVRFLDFGVARWETVEVRIRGAESLEDIAEAVRDAAAPLVKDLGDRLLVLRVRLTGRTPLHGRLLGDPERLLNEARSAAFGLGAESAWVARVDVETRPPVAPEALRERADALGDLARLLAEAPEDPQLLRDLEEDVGLLARRLKPDVAESVEDPALRHAIGGDFTALARDAAPWLLARLDGEEV